MQERLSQLINIFVEGVEEDFGEKIAALIHGSLHVWRKTQKILAPKTKDLFRQQARELLEKFTKLSLVEAEHFVDGFLAAVADKYPNFWS